MNVPLVDLAWQQAEVAAEVESGWRDVLARSAFIQGPAAERFEHEFARYCGVAHCVGVANGTDALELALRALGIGAGDRVIVPANTFVATVEAVVRAGAMPLLVDCDDTHLLIDVDQTLDALPHARALLPVHLYGQLAPMELLVDAARERDVLVIEDAAQSQGASRHGRSMGTWGAAAATSFYPGKNLGAYGDAGAVLTVDDDIARHVRAIANHGSAEKYRHDVFGFNSRLDGLQAVVLSAKLARLDEWNELRRSAAQRYAAMLADDDRITLPATLDGNTHVWHLFVIRVPNRDAVLQRMNAAGIGAGIHYPIPVHLHPPFGHLADGPGSFPVSEAAAASMLSLPVYPGITCEQQDRVVGELRAALDAEAKVTT